MSNKALLTQATHTLHLLSDLSADDMKILHDGHLSDLVCAIKNGTLKDREVVCRALGLYEPIIVSEHRITLDYNQGTPWREFFPPDIMGLRGAGVEVWEIRLLKFHTHISEKEVRISISEIDRERPWETGGTEHLKSLPALPREMRPKDTSVVCFGYWDCRRPNRIVRFNAEGRYGECGYFEDGVVPVNTLVMAARLFE